MQKAIWRFLNNPPQSAEVNMAIDEAIAIAFSEQKVIQTIRFYQWSEPSFSIGSFQKLGEDWINALEKETKGDPISIVRRITGGRALLHDREITYAIVADTKNPLFSSGLKGTYYSIAKGLLEGLHALGIEAQVYRPIKNECGVQQKEPLCYASTSWYEISVGKKKLIGSAQRRWRGHFLQHGSLMLERPQEDFLNHSQWVSNNQRSLSEQLPSLPSLADIVNALKEGFERALDIILEPAPLSPYEQEIVERLVLEKYGNTRWNRFREYK